MGVVQFADLEELLAELPRRQWDQPVRVAALEITEGTGQHGIRLLGIGVHVRMFDTDGHVLACYVVVARLQVMGDVVLSDPGGKKRERAVERAEALKMRIRGRLEREGCAVSGGVIDIGKARLLPAMWSGDGHEAEGAPEGRGV